MDIFSHLTTSLAFVFFLSFFISRMTFRHKILIHYKKFAISAGRILLPRFKFLEMTIYTSEPHQ